MTTQQLTDLVTRLTSGYVARFAKIGAVPTEAGIKAVIGQYLIDNPIEGKTDAEVNALINQYLIDNPIDVQTDTEVNTLIENYMTAHPAEGNVYAVTSPALADVTGTSIELLEYNYSGAGVVSDIRYGAIDDSRVAVFYYLGSDTWQLGVATVDGVNTTTVLVGNTFNEDMVNLQIVLESGNKLRMFYFTSTNGSDYYTNVIDITTGARTAKTFITSSLYSSDTRPHITRVDRGTTIDYAMHAKYYQKIVLIRSVIADSTFTVVKDGNLTGLSFYSGITYDAANDQYVGLGKVNNTTSSVVRFDADCIEVSSEDYNDNNLNYVSTYHGITFLLGNNLYTAQIDAQYHKVAITHIDLVNKYGKTYSVNCSYNDSDQAAQPSYGVGNSALLAITNKILSFDANETANFTDITAPAGGTLVSGSAFTVQVGYGHTMFITANYTDAQGNMVPLIHRMQLYNNASMLSEGDEAFAVPVTVESSTAYSSSFEMFSDTEGALVTVSAYQSSQVITIRRFRVANGVWEEYGNSIDYYTTVKTNVQIATANDNGVLRVFYVAGSADNYHLMCLSIDAADSIDLATVHDNQFISNNYKQVIVDSRVVAGVTRYAVLVVSYYLYVTQFSINATTFALENIVQGSIINTYTAGSIAFVSDTIIRVFLYGSEFTADITVSDTTYSIAAVVTITSSNSYISSNYSRPYKAVTIEDEHVLLILENKNNRLAFIELTNNAITGFLQTNDSSIYIRDAKLIGSKVYVIWDNSSGTTTAATINTDLSGFTRRKVYAKDTLSLSPTGSIGYAGGNNIVTCAKGYNSKKSYLQALNGAGIKTVDLSTSIALPHTTMSYYFDAYENAAVGDVIGNVGSWTNGLSATSSDPAFTVNASSEVVVDGALTLGTDHAFTLTRDLGNGVIDTVVVHVTVKEVTSLLVTADDLTIDALDGSTAGTYVGRVNVEHATSASITGTDFVVDKLGYLTVAPGVTLDSGVTANYSLTATFTGEVNSATSTVSITLVASNPTVLALEANLTLWSPFDDNFDDVTGNDSWATTEHTPLTGNGSISIENSYTLVSSLSRQLNQDFSLHTNMSSTLTTSDVDASFADVFTLTVAGLVVKFQADMHAASGGNQPWGELKFIVTVAGTTLTEDTYTATGAEGNTFTRTGDIVITNKAGGKLRFYRDGHLVLELDSPITADDSDTVIATSVNTTLSVTNELFGIRWYDRVVTANEAIQLLGGN